MAQTTIVKGKVLELTKYGYKDAEGFVSLSKNLTEFDKMRLIPGLEFEAEYYMADPTEKKPQGTRYLNKILSVVNSRPAQTVTDVTPPVDQERAKKFTPTFNKKIDAPISVGLTKEEWAAKDQRISRQGVIQAAVIALAPVVSLETLAEEAIKLANSMLEFVKGE